MKFGKQLQQLKETLGTERDSIPTLQYKGLKKLLKADHPPQSGAQSQAALHQAAADPTLNPQESHNAPLSEEDQLFLATLTQDILAFNAYYIEQEETFIIRLQSLEQAAETAPQEQQPAIQAALADLHGEMVLLVHWSLLNCAAVTKILKKHDKRGDGAALRAPILSSILRQPFYSTEHVTDMVASADACMRKLQGTSQAVPAEGQRRSTANAPVAHLSKRTQAALDMWQQLGEGASTPSTVLPASKRLRTCPSPTDVLADSVLGRAAAAMLTSPPAKTRPGNSSAADPASAPAPSRPDADADAEQQAAQPVSRAGEDAEQAQPLGGQHTSAEKVGAGQSAAAEQQSSTAHEAVSSNLTHEEMGRPGSRAKSQQEPANADSELEAREQE